MARRLRSRTQVEHLVFQLGSQMSQSSNLQISGWSKSVLLVFCVYSDRYLPLIRPKDSDKTCGFQSQHQADDHDSTGKNRKEPFKLGRCRFVSHKSQSERGRCSSNTPYPAYVRTCVPRQDQNRTTKSLLPGIVSIVIAASHLRHQAGSSLLVSPPL